MLAYSCTHSILDRCLPVRILMVAHLATDSPHEPWSPPFACPDPASDLRLGREDRCPAALLQQPATGRSWVGVSAPGQLCAVGQHHCQDRLITVFAAAQRSAARTGARL